MWDAIRADVDALLTDASCAVSVTTHPGAMEWWRWRGAMPLMWPTAERRPYWVHDVFETLCLEDVAARCNDTSGDELIAATAGAAEMARLRAMTGMDG